MVASLSWIAMAGVGLHDSVFWAFLIFLAVYIPVAGGVFAGVAPPLFALVQFPGYGQAIILLIALQLIGMVIGNVVYPRMQGRSLNLDPVMVLLALAFWSAIWGVTGAFRRPPTAEPHGAGPSPPAPSSRLDAPASLGVSRDPSPEHRRPPQSHRRRAQGRPGDRRRKGLRQPGRRRRRTGRTARAL